MIKTGRSFPSKYSGTLFKSRILRAGIVTALLFAFLLFGLCAAGRLSVTFDEFAHIPAGVAYWKKQAFYIYPHNPPLARLILSLPILNSAKLPPVSPVGRTDPEYRWEFAEAFLMANRPWDPVSTVDFSRHPENNPSNKNWSYDHIIYLARLPILILGLLLGTVIFYWSKILFGYKGALLSLFLYTFSPNMLAHASLATTDLAMACFSTLAMFALFRFIRSQSLVGSALMGFAFGLAALSKFSAILLLVPICLTLFLPLQGKQEWPRHPLLLRVAYCLVFMITTWIIFCSGYLFSDMFQTLKEIPLHSNVFTIIKNALPDWLPVPFPSSALIGIDSEWIRGEQKLGVFYLLGKLSNEGWRTYFPVALLTKVPIPLLLLWIVSFLTAARKYIFRREAGKVITLLLPPILFIAFFIFMTKSNYGIRYILVCFPFLFILSGIIVHYLRNIWIKAALVVLLVWHVVGLMMITPNYLTYFNEIAGGPRGGIKILADSNLDWGQQLKELKRYMMDKGIKEVALSYTGPVDPEVYGIHWKPLRLGKTRGIAAVSANHLVGFFYPLDGFFGSGIQDFTPLIKLNPEAVIANSMYIYDLR